MSENRMICIIVGMFLLFLIYLVSNEPKTIKQNYEDIVYYATVPAQLEITYFKSEETGKCSSLIEAVVDDNSAVAGGWLRVTSSVSCDKIPEREENDERD